MEWCVQDTVQHIIVNHVTHASGRQGSDLAENVVKVVQNDEIFEEQRGVWRSFFSENR